MENGWDNYERFPMLEVEWLAVAGALPLFIHGENDRLQSLCNALSEFFNFSGRWDERLSLNQQAEEKAVAAEDFFRAGWRAYGAGWVYLLRGQADEVMACATRSGSHWEKAPQAGAREKATTIRLCGLGQALKEDFPAAIESFRHALELLREIAPESLDVAAALSSLGDAELQYGDYAASRRDFHEALRIAKAVKDRDGVATYTGNLAELALFHEDWLTAETLAREALDLAEALGRKELIGGDCHRLAMALAQQGKPQEGLPYARRAVKILSDLRRPASLADAHAALKACGG